MKLKNEFRLRPLGELCEVTGGNSAPQGEEYFRGGTIPFVRMRDLGGYHHTTCLDTTRDAVTPAAIEKMRLKIFEPGCILFPRSGSVQLNHRAILAIRACIVSHIGILKQFSDDIDVRYLYWFLVRYDMGVIAKQTTGLDLVGFSDVKKISVPVPNTLDEQHRIVSEIEKQFTRLEAGVAALRRVQANLKRYRAAVLKAACEGRLVPTEAELHRKLKTKDSKLETGTELLARILTERHQNWQGRGQYKQPVAPEPPTDVELPEGWTWAAFDQVCAAVSDEGKKIAKAEYLAEGKVPVIDQGEEFIGGFSNDESLAYAGELPVILFGDHTRRFKLANERFIVGADGVKLIGLTAAWDCKFLWYQFQQLDFEDRGYSRHFQFVRKAPLRLPPLAEQTRIVAEVERRLSVVEELESVVTANLQRATRLRQSILQKAFTGQLA
jgi:type I restriction enzyme S subunit